MKERFVHKTVNLKAVQPVAALLHILNLRPLFQKSQPVYYSTFCGYCNSGTGIFERKKHSFFRAIRERFPAQGRAALRLYAHMLFMFYKKQLTFCKKLTYTNLPAMCYNVLVYHFMNGGKL